MAGGGPERLAQVQAWERVASGRQNMVANKGTAQRRDWRGPVARGSYIQRFEQTEWIEQSRLPAMNAWSSLPKRTDYQA